MPINSASGSVCTINLLPAPSTRSASRFGLETLNKIPCQEYLHQTIKNPTTGTIQEIVTIESQEASPFEIVLDVKSNAYSLLNPPTTGSESHSGKLTPDDYIFETYLDGVYVGSIEQRKYLPDIAYMSAVSSGDYSTYRTFQFAPVQLVDPDERVENPTDGVCEDQEVIRSLGTIQIDIRRCNLVAERPAHIDDRPEKQTSNQMKFSERSKKALLSNTAGLTQSFQQTLPPPLLEWNPTDMDDHPFLQFIFKYKPRAMLEADGTIPREIPSTETLLRSGNSGHNNNDDDEIIVVKMSTKQEKACCNIKPSTSSQVIYVDIDTDSETAEKEKDKKSKGKQKLSTGIQQQQNLKTEEKENHDDDQEHSRSKSNFFDLTGSDD
ncbi:hypothetical protein Pst134EB_002258 [Puccinia striiformis f. sp. tritici]|nr:hypothetical protein Pst134EB_002258 [Puccinia striiformis f. sp. tritici]